MEKVSILSASRPVMDDFSNAVKSGSEHIEVADKMAYEFLNFGFESQNEMILHIQKVLIQDRKRKLESLQNEEKSLQEQLRRTEMALVSLS